MGLTVDIFRSHFGDCSNGGISSKARSVCLVNAEGPFNPSEGYPAVILVRGPMQTVHAVPAVLNAAGQYVKAPGHYMNGGTFVACSDSRFSQLVEKLLGHPFYGAIAFHDRTETDEQNAACSY